MNSENNITEIDKGGDLHAQGRPILEPLDATMGDHRANQRVIDKSQWKKCPGHEGHYPGELLPPEAFYKSSHYCKKCANKQTNAYQKRKRAEARIERESRPKADPQQIIHKLTNGESVVDPSFILSNAIELFFGSNRVEQKIKLLELMAKYSPNMKDVKPTDKKALMASLVESLKKERKIDGLQTDSDRVAG